MAQVFILDPHYLGPGLSVTVERRVHGEVIVDLREMAQVYKAKDTFLTQVGVELTKEEWQVLDASEPLVKHRIGLYVRFKNGDIPEPQNPPIYLSEDAFVSIESDEGGNVRILKTMPDDTIQTVSMWPNNWRTLTHRLPEITQLVKDLALKTE